ncbi:hypothetical protein [Mycobacteroides abscessus]|uniref:Uncharacterized protein n=1 Tax=Mycobacteroides abscessus TaxID=36809 RepID=A0A0U0ZR36_9MYCO|nr:hypothetical protein [Mycobacteroides abscessus]CPV66357.1 Uncharacterised protein [Mycobacteroides abscessus]
MTDQQHDDPVSHVRELIKHTAQRQSERPRRSYPRLREDLVGHRAAASARRRIAKGYRLPEQPARSHDYGVPIPAHAPWREAPTLAFDEHTHLPEPDVWIAIASIVAGCGAAARLVPLLASPVVAFIAIMALITAGLLCLRLGLITKARLALMAATGYHWSHDAIEYLPWIDTDRREPIEPSPEDEAILTVAEDICGQITADTAHLDGYQGILDVDQELHEIAWSVADLTMLARPGDNEGSTAQTERLHQRERTRESLVARLAALHEYSCALHKLRLAYAELQPTSAHVTAALSSEVLNRQAAEHIAQIAATLAGAPASAGRSVP